MARESCEVAGPCITLVAAYEREHFPIDLPDPVEAIKFRLEQEEKDHRALIGVIGQRTRTETASLGPETMTRRRLRASGNVDLHRGRYIVASPLALQPLELIDGPVELALVGGFVAKERVHSSGADGVR